MQSLDIEIMLFAGLSILAIASGLILVLARDGERAPRTAGR